MKKNILKITMLLAMVVLGFTACTDDLNSGIFYGGDEPSPYRVTQNGADTLHTASLVAVTDSSGMDTTENGVKPKKP